MDLTLSFDDSVAAPIQFSTVQVLPPTGLTATAVGAGGTFAAGTYFWEVTATTALGETTVSNEASATLVLNGSANLAWTLPQGVITHIKVYRATVAGVENVLVTTLGPTATTFTDTNVGAAGTPPTTNTATVQDTVLLTGFAWYAGYSFRETSGSTSASIEIQDTIGVIGVCNLSSGGSETEVSPNTADPINGFIKVHVNSGVVKGVVYARIPPVNC